MYYLIYKPEKVETTITTEQQRAEPQQYSVEFDKNYNNHNLRMQFVSALFLRRGSKPENTEAVS